MSVFTESDVIAAHQWRLGQARTLLRFADRMRIEDPFDIGRPLVRSLLAAHCLDSEGKLVVDTEAGDPDLEERVERYVDREEWHKTHL
ncbi:MAG TPA: hypothetical protein VIY26_13750 [Acidimicrobiales bacterium]